MQTITALRLHSAAAVRPRPSPPTSQARAACSRTNGSSSCRVARWSRQRPAGPSSGSPWVRCAAAASSAAEEGEAEAEAQVDAWGDPIGPDEVGVLDKDLYLDTIPDGVEGKTGYTPYDFIDFTDIPLKHEVVTKVQRPVSEVYALWSNRLNWPEWFGMIEDIGFTEDDEDVCALNMWYRWGMTPWLELYVALRRSHAEPNKYIVEEPADGAPIVAAVLFQEDDDGRSTLVTLRVSYLLPRVLFEFAGTMAVYGDVNRKLGRSMEQMREWVEAVDFEEVMADAEANMARIREELPERHRQQQEYNKQWEKEKQREDERSEQQAAAAAAAAAVQAQAEAAAQQALDALDLQLEGQVEPAAPKAKRSKKASGSGAVSNPMTKRRSRKAADAGQ